MAICGERRVMFSKYWRLSNRADPIGCALADRHYSRQKHGTPQFMPAGSCRVLVSKTNDAVFGVSYPRYTRRKSHNRAWNISIFRNESPHLSSEMIGTGLACVRWLYRDVLPRDGVITYIDSSKVKSPNAGYCFKCAGFKKIGVSKKGLLILHLPTVNIPEAIIPLRAQLRLFLA